MTFTREQIEKVIGRRFSANEAEIVDDILEQGEIKPLQNSKWIGNLVYLCERLNSKIRSHRDIDWFWVRIHGFFTEIIPYFEKMEEFCTTYEQTEYLKLKFYQASIEIRNKFTEDELLFIEYQRHCRVHVSPEMLSIKVKKAEKGSLKINRLYKGKNVVDLTEGILRMLAETQKNSNISAPAAEKLIAVEFANRVYNQIQQLNNEYYNYVHNIKEV